MALENKIQHFMDVSIKSAQQQRDAVLEEYKKGLDSLFESHKIDAEKNAALQEQIEAENLKRKAYKAYLQESMEIKRKLSIRQKEMVTQIFSEVNTLLKEYKRTDEYKHLLLSQILSAKEIAGEEKVEIYIDPEDSEFIKELENKSHTSLTISKYSFGGGTRVVIPSKNILIDNSFESKLSEAKENFKLTL